MIIARSYANNKLETTTIEKTSFLKKTVWINCENPSKEEINKLTKKTGVSHADIVDCLDQSEKPRLQRDQNYFFFIIGVPIRKGEKEEIVTSPLGIFVGKRFLLTVHKFKIKALSDFVKNEEDLKPVFQQGQERIIYNLLMSVLKDFYVIIEELEQNLEKIETKVIKTESERIQHDILGLKKTLLYVRRTLIDNRDVINSVKESTLVKKRALLYDLYIEFVQQIDMVELARERLTSVLEIYFSSVSNNLNEKMKY
ncbi:unnamed protein product, partial [marine sediment metagenome]